VLTSSSEKNEGFAVDNFYFFSVRTLPSRQKLMNATLVIIVRKYTMARIYSGLNLFMEDLIQT
jgi:hypothetical protein